MMPKLSHDEAANLIAANASTETSCFMHELTENQLFDERLYWQLLSAIQVVAEDLHGEIVLHKPIVKSIFLIQNMLLRHLIYHFDDKDEYQITNLPENYVMHLDSLTNLLKMLSN